MKKSRIIAVVLLSLSLSTSILAVTREDRAPRQKQHRLRGSLIERVIRAFSDVPIPPIPAPPPAPKP